MEKEPKFSLREEVINVLNNEQEWQAADEVLREHILSKITEESIQAHIEEMDRRVHDNFHLRYWNEYSDDEKRKDAIEVVAVRTLFQESDKASSLDPATKELLAKLFGEDKKEN